MIQIYIFFLWGYFKDHLSRIVFSLFGISLGIALFFTTQVNSWRAQESIIDAETGYAETNYLGHFQSNEEGNYGDERFLKELYFRLPNQIEFDALIIEDAYYENDHSSLLRFPIIGKDLLKSINGHSSYQSSENKTNLKYFITRSLFNKLFQNKKTASISICNQNIELNASEFYLLPRDGSFIATDIEYLQQICDRKGRIQKVVLIQNSEIVPSDLIPIIEFAKQKKWNWESREFIRERSGKALGSLKVNLTIVSLISVLISFFMVANTFSGIYLARRKEFGILLSIGVSRLQNLFLFLSQGLPLGTLGSILGLLIGQILLNFDFLTENNTITDKNQVTSYHQIPNLIYITSIGIGIAGAISSSLFSSIRSYFIKPIELIREKNSDEGHDNFNEVFLSVFKFGILFCLIGVSIGFVPIPKSLVSGLLGVGLVIFGFICIFPFTLSKSIDLVLGSFDKIHLSPTFRIAWEEIKLEPIPNTLTAATILLASSLVLTLTVLTDSYEKTLIRWVDDDNQFDYSIINASKLASGAPGVPTSLFDHLKNDPLIERIEPFIIKTKFPIGDNYYTLHVYPFPSNEQEILVSSNFCYLEKRCTGDSIEIQTEKGGKVLFKIKGEREHFFSERGTIMMNLDQYKTFFSYTELNSIRISFKNKSTIEEGMSYLQNQILDQKDDLKILSKESLKSLYLEGMRSVFSILDSLKSTAILISILALMTSLVYNIKEKSKLIATLRAIGLSRIQLFYFIFFQSTFFVSIGLFMGFINSLIVAPLVVFGVNRNAFGWILDFHYPFIMVFYFLIFIPLASVIVSIYPFLVAYRKPLREALNYE